jgi:hypothetical protein
MDLEMIDATTGYLTTATGSILRIELAQSGEGPLSTIEVANGLVFPRGVAVSGGRLFVADLGPSPCGDPFPTCFGRDVEEEFEFIEASGGSLLSFEVEPDGSLTNPQVLVPDLPVASTEHGPNDVEIGYDGFVYLSVGNVDKLWEQPDRIESLTHPNRDLLGTILRVNPETGERSVYANGLRNVFGLAFGPNGIIFAVDNDGPTIRGAYPESLLAIKGGEDFGYPFGGAWVDQTKTAPLSQLNVHGTSAVHFIESGPGSPGLLLGGPDRLTYVPFDTDGTDFFVPFVEPVVDVLNVSGYVTSIDGLPDGRIVITVSSIYGGSGNRLMVLSTVGE